MNRRDFLATLGGASIGGFAGCVDTSALSSGTSYPEGPQRRVTLHSQDTVPDEHNIRIAVELLDSLITHSQTARLRLTAVNEGQKRGVSFTVGMCALFNREKGWSDSPRGLVLHDPTDTKYIEREENQWVRDHPSDESVGFDAYDCGITTYQTGEEQTNEYLLWDDYRIEGYFEPGTYRWEEEVELTEVPPQSPDGPVTLATFTWGFSLTVKRVDG